MSRKIAKSLALPLEIPAERIGLPTRGATVTKCTAFHEGEKDPGPIAGEWGLTFSADILRYEGVIHPVDVTAPDIHFEAGMPLDWNGKLIQQGGAGINGFVPPCSMPLHGQDRGEYAPLRQGYVVFGSDSGHEIAGGDINDCRWILNKECFENFAYQSLKKTRDAVIYLTEQVYGEKPRRVYFFGGSNGGRECMKAIQNYPEDYDGAICFFPVLFWTLKLLMDSRNARALERLGDKGFISREKYDRIDKKIMEMLDGLDNGRDQVISNLAAAMRMRREAKKEVRELVTQEQFEMLQTFASPMTLPFPLAYGEISLPGYPVFEGTSVYSHYESLALAKKAGIPPLGDHVISAVYTGDTQFDTHTFHPEEWKERILEVSRWMDAYSTDLDAFQKKGGKLLLIQGTTDPQVTVHGTIQYYERLRERYGKEALGQFMRFYLAPGYGHGMDGTFLISADFLGALDQWVEENVKPEGLVVSDRSPDTFGRTRPLCEYPGYPVYSGKGDINRAENFLISE